MTVTNENGTSCFYLWDCFSTIMLDLLETLLETREMKMYGSWEEGEKIHMPVYFSYTQGMWISVCVDVRSSQMMIQLTGVSRAYLTVPRVGES